jgi:hypothetical protein
MNKNTKKNDKINSLKIFSKKNSDKINADDYFIIV